MERSAMGSNERKAQLLTIMRAHRERATRISEFSRTGIAREAGVTPKYLSMLIGPEYHAAAEGLTGKRRSSDESSGRALEENTRLRRELEKARQQLNDLAHNSIDEALRLIDQLDEDNRLLRGRVRILDQRLQQREIAVPAGGTVQVRPRPSLGLVPADK
jgi:hypothetical protein